MMIKVKIELHKFGNPKDVEVLFEVDIANDGTGTPETGNYRYTIFDCQQGRIVKKGKLKNFDRKRTALGLVQSVMKRKMTEDKW